LRQLEGSAVCSFHGDPQDTAGVTVGDGRGCVAPFNLQGICQGIRGSISANDGIASIDSLVYQETIGDGNFVAEFLVEVDAEKRSAFNSCGNFKKIRDNVNDDITDFEIKCLRNEGLQIAVSL
jgi:hypothetical protein